MFRNQIKKENKVKKQKNITMNQLLIGFGLAALVFILFVIVYYAYMFWGFSITPDVEHFAQFGDFFGGTLNPILAFLAFIALLYTIKLQSDSLKMSKEELSATREELEKTRIAQQEQSKSLKLQNKATELQMFENTFFKLIDIHNSSIERFRVNYNISEDTKCINKHGDTAIKLFLKNLKMRNLWFIRVSSFVS